MSDGELALTGKKDCDDWRRNSYLMGCSSKGLGKLVCRLLLVMPSY
jgi:hypothetical protein